MSPPANPPASILCCDHRGEGLAVLLSGKAFADQRIRETSDLRSSRAALAEEAFDLIVLHPLAEGGSAELEELERLRGEARAIPLLLVVDPGDARSAIAAARALQRGAFDLVHRDAAPEEFALRIGRLLEDARAAAEIEELRHRAVHDDRTDLLRPVAFEKRLAEHFSAAERHRLPLAFVLIDLDGFGMVNKDYDHVVGDRVIARVGAAIRDALRAEDVAGRLGGDEFAVLLPYTGRIDAAHAVRRLRDEIRRQSRLVEGVPEHFEIHASLGFETFDGSDLSSFAEMRSHAEAALREAKRRGGDRGVYYRSLARPA
jgi:diguanylate cyclase (GGDEF)-like protein